MGISSRQKRLDSEILPELEACPFLGLEQDSATWLAYPHPANCCHRARPTCNLSLSYQESTCLTKDHINCPGFTHGWNGPLPDMYCGETDSPRPTRNLLLPALAAVLILFVIAGWLAFSQGWLPFSGGGDSKDPTSVVSLSDQQQTTGAALLVPSQTDTPAPLPTSTPNRQQTQTALAALVSSTPSPTPTEVFTPTPALPTPGPALGTPFGPDERYLLHQLATGESMGTLVSLYNTSNLVIEASNVLVPGASIWPGTVLVIVPGEKNPAAVIRFKVLLLEFSSSIDDLAETYGVSVEDLRTYNSLGQDDIVPAGRYLIIPVP